MTRAGALALGGVACAAAVLFAPIARSASADVPVLALRLECPTRAGKGRIVCTLEVEAREGRVLRWADALVVSAPEFAPPLRSRISASLPDEGAVRAGIPIALFARGENTGVLRVKARAVVCLQSSRDACVPETRVIEAPVAVTRDAGARPESKLNEAR